MLLALAGGKRDGHEATGALAHRTALAATLALYGRRMGTSFPVESILYLGPKAESRPITESRRRMESPRIAAEVLDTLMPMEAAPVAGRGRHRCQIRIGEFAQDTAQIAPIHAEIAEEVARRGFSAGIDLIEHPCLGQRQRSIGELFFEQANLAGVEAVECPDFGDLPGWIGHDGAPSQLIDIVNDIVD